MLHAPHRAPNANAICEGFLGSLRRECLDHILILDEDRLLRTLKECLRYFDHARPHQGIEQSIPWPPESLPHSGIVISHPILGGLHRDYCRQAAFSHPSHSHMHWRERPHEWVARLALLDRQYPTVSPRKHPLSYYWPAYLPAHGERSAAIANLDSAHIGRMAFSTSTGNIPAVSQPYLFPPRWPVAAPLESQRVCAVFDT
jgi:hypothetical protein